MININLLPYHLRPIKRTPLPYIAAVALLALAIFGMVAVWLSSMAAINAKTAEYNRHMKELESLAAVVEEYNKLTELKEAMGEKIVTIKTIASDRIIWSRQLFNISRLTPDNVWYNNISQKEKTTTETRMEFDPKTKTNVTKTVPVKKPVLELGGYVMRVEGGYPINPLTLNLSQDPEFSALFQLNPPKLQDTDFQGFKVRSFTIECDIVSKGDESAAAPVPGGVKPPGNPPSGANAPAGDKK